MNLLLISDTKIIHHIFSLICQKLNISLKIQKTNSNNEKYDFIIVDQNFIDDKFNIIKQFSKKLGAISSEDLPFDKARDFIIPRPFLPAKLEALLKEQIEIIKFEEQKERDKKSKESLDEDFLPEDSNVTVPIVDYVESLADDIYDDISEENDESIVSIASVNNGGVLDSNELSKINEILKDGAHLDKINLEKNDWKNISDIIDDALEEVREYEFDLDDTDSQIYTLILNKYNMNDLRPLFEKCNQQIIDKLSAGNSVTLRLLLKEKN